MDLANVGLNAKERTLKTRVVTDLVYSGMNEFTAKDGLLSEPERCQVDFKGLECKGGAQGASCLTPRQVKSAQAIVSPAKTAKGEVLFPRLEPGTELRWARLAVSSQAPTVRMAPTASSAAMWLLL